MSGGFWPPPGGSLAGSSPAGSSQREFGPLMKSLILPATSGHQLNVRVPTLLDACQRLKDKQGSAGFLPAGLLPGGGNNLEKKNLSLPGPLLLPPPPPLVPPALPALVPPALVPPALLVVGVFAGWAADDSHGSEATQATTNTTSASQVSRQRSWRPPPRVASFFSAPSLAVCLRRPFAAPSAAAHRGIGMLADGGARCVAVSSEFPIESDDAVYRLPPAAAASLRPTN